jgi:hypothetical protein
MNILDNIKQKLTTIKQKVEPSIIEEEVMQEMQPTTEERMELQDMVTELDPGYIQYSSEIVGYDTREHQWNTYRTVMAYMEPSDSVLDFGCGRGDFKSVYEGETGAELDYMGLELSQVFVDAAAEIYPNYDIQLTDWFKIPTALTKDWCINIHSLNLRYDADIIRDDKSYRLETISQMYKHANKGVIVLLASDIAQKDDGLISTDPGELLNWAQGKFGNVALDHTFSDELFALIIYKS